jgi:outer membrane receptor for monomeric catechols
MILFKGVCANAARPRPLIRRYKLIMFQEGFMKKVFLLLLALAIGFIRLPLFSQEVAQPQIQEQKKAETAAPKRAPSTFVIGEVVVRDKHSLNIEDASTTTTITGEEIKQRSDKSLADSLQMVPGVVVSQTAKGFTGFSMRGFQHERIAILIDGIPVLDPYYGGGNTDISKHPVQNVDKIVVNRGRHRRSMARSEASAPSTSSPNSPRKYMRKQMQNTANRTTIRSMPPLALP